MFSKVKDFMLSMFGLKSKKNTIVIQNKFIFFISIFIIPMMIILFFVIKDNKKVDTTSKEDYLCMSTKEKLNEAYESYEYYNNKITEEELVMLWVKMFSTYTYKFGGDPKFNQTDCIGTVWLFLKSLGYKGKMVDVNEFTLILEKQSKRITNYFNIRHTQIIIFHPINGIPHVGIIYKKSSNYGIIQYMDMSGATGNYNFQHIKFDDPRIKGIYQISFDQWKGNLVQ